MTARLNYPRYIATTCSPGICSPAHIDWRLIRRLATHHAPYCVGTHFISPVIGAPDLRFAPWEWTKWRVARFLRAGILGYEEEDFAALEGSGRAWIVDPKTGAAAGSNGDLEEGRGGGISGLGKLTQPHALAYALCDSPVGMLVFVLRALRLSGGAISQENENGWFTKERIITLTKLAWLPGPEHALRFWAGCENPQVDEAGGGGGGSVRAKVTISVFVGGGALGEEYACPAWANADYDVIQTHRYPGRTRTKGLLAFEQPEVIFEGVRSLAKGLLAQNSQAFEVGSAQSVVAPLEKVVVIKDGHETQPGTSAAKEKGKGLSAPEVLATPAVTPAEEEEEGKTARDKGKEKEVVGQDVLPPPAPIPVRDPLLDGESPDTLVEESKTPPLEKTT